MNKKDSQVEDRAITSSSQDRLSRDKMVTSVCEIVTKREGTDSIAIGIEGAWGSGKTSFINLIKERLRKHIKEPAKIVPKKCYKLHYFFCMRGKKNKNTSQPEHVLPTDEAENKESNILRKLIIFDFNPWMHMDQESMLVDFFMALEGELRKYTTGQEIKKIAKTLMRYALSTSVNVAATIAGTKLPLSLKFEKQLSQDNEETEKSVMQQKEDISNIMEKLDYKIVCVIDDIDRLEADEVLLIFKLVRSVADLPNIIFILCYDRNKIAKFISSKITSDEADNKSDAGDIGDLYVDKIINLPIPLVNPYENLRSELFVDYIGSALKELGKEVDRLDLQTQYRNEFSSVLQTPRDIKRLASTISETLSIIGAEEINIEDFLRIEIIRLHAPETYQKIFHSKNKLLAYSFEDISDIDADIARQYQKCLSQSSMGSPSPAGPKDVLYDYFISSLNVQSTYQIVGVLRSLFPRSLYGFDKSEGLLSTIKSPTIDARGYTSLRLANRHHWDKYFSLSVAPRELTQKKVKKLIYLMENPDKHDKFVNEYNSLPTLSEHPIDHNALFIEVIKDRSLSLNDGIEEKNQNDYFFLLRSFVVFSCRLSYIEENRETILRLISKVREGEAEKFILEAVKLVSSIRVLLFWSSIYKHIDEARLQGIRINVSLDFKKNLAKGILEQMNSIVNDDNYTIKDMDIGMDMKMRIFSTMCDFSLGSKMEPNAYNFVSNLDTEDAKNLGKKLAESILKDQEKLVQFLRSSDSYKLNGTEKVDLIVGIYEELLGELKNALRGIDWNKVPETEKGEEKSLANWAQDIISELERRGN